LLRWAGRRLLSGIAACAEKIVRCIARNKDILVEWMAVNSESYCDTAKAKNLYTIFSG